MLKLKRSLNQELLAVEAISGKLHGVTSKDEFYSFIKRLGERLDKIETNLDTYLGFGDEIKETEAKIKNISKKLARQEDLTSEIKQVRKLKGKVESVEGSTVTLQKFNAEISKLLQDIAGIKKAMLTDKAFEIANAKIQEASRKSTSLEKNMPTRDEVSNNSLALSTLKQNLGKVEGTHKKNLESANEIKKQIEVLQETSLRKETFNKVEKEIKKELNSVKQLLDNSVSEIDLSDYVTKKAQVKNQEKLNELNSVTESLVRDSANTNENLQSLKKNVALRDDVDRISSDVKGIGKSIDTLQSTVETLAKATQKHFEQELSQTTSKFDKELTKLKDKIDHTQGKKPGGGGLVSKLTSGVSDFFKEDVQPKKQEKKVWKASDFLDDKKKTGKDSGKGLILGGLAVIVLLVALVFLITQISDDGEQAPTPVEVIEERLSIDTVEEPELGVAEQQSTEDLEQAIDELPIETLIEPETTDVATKQPPEVSEDKTIETIEEPPLVDALEEPQKLVITEDQTTEVVEEQLPITTVEDLQSPDDLTEQTDIGDEPTEDISVLIPEDTLPETFQETESDIEADSSDGIIDVSEIDSQEETDSEQIQTETQCKKEFECKERTEGEYWFNCHIDEEETCRCFITDAEGCNVTEDVAQDTEIEEEEEVSNNVGYLIVAGGVLVVMLVIFMLTLRGPKKKTEKKPVKESIDLEKFFDKK